VASLPFRFKAGGDAKMPSAVGGHSHRATTKVAHKGFKSRKSTKGQLRDAAKGMSHAGTMQDQTNSFAPGREKESYN
jgi:hypothetical protein